MKTITKSRLKTIIEKLVKKTLKEEHGNNSMPEQQLEDLVGVMELISHKIMGFPTDNPQAVALLPSLIEVLERVDFELSKVVQVDDR